MSLVAIAANSTANAQPAAPPPQASERADDPSTEPPVSPTPPSAPAPQSATAATDTPPAPATDGEDGAHTGAPAPTPGEARAEQGVPPAAPTEVHTAGATDAPIQGASSDPEEEEDSAYPRVSPGARLMAGAHLVRTHPVSDQIEADSRQPFFLQQARLKLRADLHKRVRLSFSADLDSKPAIRSAFAQFHLERALQVRIGRFKRPMSRTEMTSIGELPFKERGIFNERLIEDAGWGDRALGVMARGKFKHPRFRYWAAVMNSAPNVDVDRFRQFRGVDLLGRVQYNPIKALKVAVNGGYKNTEARIDGPNLSMFAIGGDILLTLGKFSMTLESIAAQNPYPPSPPDATNRQPWAMMVIGYANYRVDLGGDFELQPTVLGEWVDTDLEVSQDEALRTVVGCNLLWNKKVRIMPQISIVTPLGEISGRSQLRGESYIVVFSVAL